MEDPKEQKEEVSTVLNIEKFNPTKAELTEKVNKYKSLTIKGVDDKKGYNDVDDARKDLQKTRTQIGKDGKALRDDANKFAKKVIAVEKELVAIIEPLEKDLKEQTDAIDLINEKEKRKALIPARIEKLKTIEVEVSEDELLEMDSKEYLEFFNIKETEFLEEKARKLQEKENMLREQERLVEIKKEAEEKAKKEADEKAEKDRQEEAERVKLEREKLEFEKQKVEDAKIEAEAEVKRLKQEAIEKEEKEKQDALDKIENEKKEAARLKKIKKYQSFLKENGYTEETKEDFIVKSDDEKVVLFKKVGEFEIKN